MAVKNNIDIVFLEYNGQPIGRVWHSKLGSTSLIRKKQLKASLGHTALVYVKDWLCRKLNNQYLFLKDLRKHRPQHHHFLDDKMERIDKLMKSMQSIEATTVDEVAEQLRGLEGTSGRQYFATLSYVLPAQYKFAGRSFRPAEDAFNAFLNYVFGSRRAPSKAESIRTRIETLLCGFC